MILTTCSEDRQNKDVLGGSSLNALRGPFLNLLYGFISSVEIGCNATARARYQTQRCIGTAKVAKVAKEARKDDRCGMGSTPFVLSLSKELLV